MSLFSDPVNAGMAVLILICSSYLVFADYEVCPSDDDFGYVLTKALVDYTKDPAASSLGKEDVTAMLRFYLSRESVMDADCSEGGIYVLVDKAEGISDDVLDMLKGWKHHECDNCWDGTVCGQSNQKGQACECRDVDRDGSYEFCRLRPVRPRQRTCTACADGTACGKNNSRGQTCVCRDVHPKKDKTGNRSGQYDFCFLKPRKPVYNPPGTSTTSPASTTGPTTTTYNPTTSSLVTTSSTASSNPTTTQAPTSTTTSTIPGFGIVGVLESGGCGNFKGWVCDLADVGTPLQIDLWLDGPYNGGGAFITSVIAYEERADVAGQCSGTTNHGFDYPLPKTTWSGEKNIYDGQPHTIYAYVQNWNKPLSVYPYISGSPKTVACSAGSYVTVRGYFDSADCSTLRGWACDLNDASTPLQIDLWLDGPWDGGGLFVTSLIASKEEQKTGGQCSSTTNHGFDDPMPRTNWNGTKNIFDGKEHTVYAYIQNWNKPLGSYPLLMASPRKIKC